MPDLVCLPNSILQRHIKRQIISLDGGFQMIADLNAYYAFVTSLKQPRMSEEFSNLKMLGQVYIVADAKDLTQIIRDVTRYGGTYRPEDLYEFIQRRADWKKIEKTVDNVSRLEVLIEWRETLIACFAFNSPCTLCR
jgi:recyclin-1